MLLGFYWNVLKVCCCMSLNIVDIHIQLLPDYTLIWFIETEWHKRLKILIVKHRP